MQPPCPYFARKLWKLQSFHPADRHCNANKVVTCPISFTDYNFYSYMFTYKRHCFGYSVLVYLQGCLTHQKLIVDCHYLLKLTWSSAYNSVFKIKLHILKFTATLTCHSAENLGSNVNRIYNSGRQ